MRLQDSLEYLSESTQQAIVNEHARRFGMETQEPLLGRLGDPAFAQHVWEHSSEWERSVIRQFVQFATRGFLTRRDWEKVSSKEQRLMSVGLTRLRRLGLVMTVRKMWSEIGYVMPQEIREQLIRCLLPELESAYVMLSKTLPYYIPTGRGIHLDLTGLLLYIRDHEIPLTQKGTVHRRYQQKMADLLTITDKHLQGLQLPIWQMESSEGRELLLALDMAWKLGLVFENDRRLVVDNEQVKRWLSQSPSNRFDDMYRIVREQYLPQEPWWDALAFVMEQVPADQWCSLQAQLHMLERAGYSLPDQADKQVAERWLHLLGGLGWVQLGIDEQEQIFWRWNAMACADEKEGWYVDPSGEITIPPLMPLQAIWKLSDFCSIQLDGSLLRAEIQDRSVQAYLTAGGHESQIIGLLQEHCVHPLPEAIGELISHWAKTARQIQIEPVYRVRTAHPGFLEEWKEIADFQPFLTQLLSPTEFLLTGEEHEKWVDLLRRYGYEPHLLDAAAGMQTKRQDTQEEQASAGLLQVAQPWDGYAVENTFPEFGGEAARITSLPKVWTQHLQSYHPQSLRDLLKRASELQLDVELQADGQSTWSGKPSDLRVEMGYWMITIAGSTGKKRMRLDDIGRVRIVVPDYLYEGN